MKRNKRRQPDTSDTSDDYKVVGCVEFISAIERDRYGFSDNLDCPEGISLIYEKDSSVLTYFKHDGMMKALYDYNIKNKYTIEEAREIHPELFL